MSLLDNLQLENEQLIFDFVTANISFFTILDGVLRVFIPYCHFLSEGSIISSEQILNTI